MNMYVIVNKLRPSTEHITIAEPMAQDVHETNIDGAILEELDLE